MFLLLYTTALACGFVEDSLMVKENVSSVTKTVSCNNFAQLNYSISVMTVPGTALGTYTPYINTKCYYIIVHCTYVL